MVMQWAQVESNAKFQGATPEKQQEIKQTFFDRNVAPAATKRGLDVDTVRSSFFTKTATPTGKVPSPFAEAQKQFGELEVTAPVRPITKTAVIGKPKEVIGKPKTVEEIPNGEAIAREQTAWLNDVATPERITELRAKGKIGAIEAVERLNKWKLLPYFNAKAVADDIAIFASMKKSQRGEVLTDEENADLHEFIDDMIETEARGYSYLGGVTNAVIQMPAFAIEFMVAFGSAGAAAPITGARIAAKVAVETGLKAGIKGFLKTAAKTVAKTPLYMPHRVVGTAVDMRINDSIAITDKGAVMFKDSKENPATTLFKAIGVNVIENLTEQLGATVVRPVLKTAGKAVGRVLPRGLTEGFKNLVEKTINLPFREAFAKFGYDGILEELGEEELGRLMRFTFDLDPEEGFSTDQFLDAIFPDKDDFLVELGAIAVFGGVSRAGFVLADKLSGQGMPKQEIEQVLDSMTELQKEKKLEDILAFETDVQTEEFDAESARIKQEAVDAGIEEEVAQNFVDTINARVIAMADSMQIPRADIVKRWGLQIQREETTAAKKDLKTFTREQKEFFRSEEFQRDIKPFEEKEISRRDVSETAQGAVKLAAPFGKDGRPTVITVFENADRSVLVHELGRVFLNDIQHFAETTDDLTVAGDWAAARQWLKVEEGQPLTMEQHEKFARGFEKFLRSGKAPVPRLQNLFNQFREWLKSVYTNAAQLDVSISPSAQSMFDGLFLTDNERIALHSIDVPQSDYDLMRNNASMKITGDTYLKEKGLKVKDSNTILRNVFVPISTRLLQINKELFHSIRKFDFNIGIFKDKQMKILTPFFDKVKKLSADDYLDLDYALKNRDTNKILEIAKRNGMEKELKTIKDLLETTRKEALAVGMEVNVIENYFPRKVLDSSKYLTFLQGTTEWNLIERQLIKAGLEHADPVIRADFINNQMAEFNFKEERQLARESTDPRARRTVQFIDPQKNAFYADSFSALTSYIGAMTNMIQMRRFWNVDSNNISESVGGIVAKLVKEGKINFAQEAELKVILRARFEQVGTTGWVAHYKNIEYISTMGNPASAITQIGDLALAAYGNGLLTSLGALTSSIRGKQRVTKEDLGIQQIAVEFTNESTSQKAVTAVFKAVGLSTIDNIGKETVINGALTKLGKKARSRDKQFEQDVHDIFGTEAKQTLKDLRDETISDNVKYLLFSELSNLQPISLSEMPVSYLRGGNLRIFYMLKTYTIKVLDIYNRDVLMEMHTNPKKALGNFIRLSSALLIMGATADELKNLLLGRAADLSDLVIDNILKLMGFSKYSIYKARREGAGSAAAALLLPPFSLVNATTMDTFDVIFKDDFDITKARTLARLPVVGKLYDWWFGRAAERKEKKKGQKSAFAL